MSAATVYDVFASAATRWPDRAMLQVLDETAAVYGIAPGEITYGQAAAEVAALSAGYEAAGYGTGHRVLLLLENRPAYFLHWLALNRLGASVVPVNPDLRHAELEYLIGHAEPAGAVAIVARAEDLRAAAGYDLPVFGPDGTPPPPAHAPNAAAGEAAMLYTSGTTGNPKGCVLLNSYFTLSGEWYRDAGGTCAITEDGERMITPLPIFHMNAMACSFMAMLTVGGCLIALDRFHPRTWWQSVRASGATCLHYLGVMPSMLMGADPSPDDTAHSARFGFGAGVDAKLQAAFEARFNLPLTEGWAMTETGCANAITANREPRLIGQSCLGRPGADIEIRLVDEAGEDVPADTPGELLIRRAGADPKKGFFDHYFKDPTATAQAWEGGWFHTGDLMRQDDQGRIFFVDRKKNVIRRSGENIAAVEVESVLMKHPAVTAAAVAAVPDALRGDEVFACLCVADPGPATAEAIVTWCLDQMAYYKAPGYVAFVDALPLTATQKIQRATLKQTALRLLDDPGTIATGHLKKRQVA